VTGIIEASALSLGGPHVEVHPGAGHPAERDDLVDVDKLIAAYYDEVPNPSVPEERVSFGTSGHRGSSLRRTFNEAHIAATSQAICEYRHSQGIDGLLYLGRDTHALSEPAWRTAIEVFAGNEVSVAVDARGRYTPTPAISHAILSHNRSRPAALADGVVVTPSHNPPADGGFKYNPTHGGPADTEATTRIEDRANELLAAGLSGVKRIAFERASSFSQPRDYLDAYVSDLGTVVDLDGIAAAGVRLGVDPLGGASVDYWAEIAERYPLDLTVVNDRVDPTFAFMTRDWDGQIRMDCSSPYAMASLIGLKDRFDVAFGNDTDADRHGIVVPGTGLLNPNHYLAAAVQYLFTSRATWPGGAGGGKTVVTSSMIDRVVAGLGRRLFEVPVGFKWFVDGLLGSSLGFGGEESAGASLLRRDGSTWTTDKDGLILCLLAAEITAASGRDPGEEYGQLTQRYGAPVFVRIDAPANTAQKRLLKTLSPDQVSASTLAGEEITAMLTEAPGNGMPIGGLKVMTANGWFAARPSGTEEVYKIYAESFRGEDHLDAIVTEAQKLVSALFAAAGV
jgi:phosphoglucomutase